MSTCWPAMRWPARCSSDRPCTHALVTSCAGVEQLYVHTLAVNEIARRFYDGEGFVVEKEETSNTAHYRGRCLDGVEGAGRTLLLRDARLWEERQ